MVRARRSWDEKGLSSGEVGIMVGSYDVIVTPLPHIQSVVISSTAIWAFRLFGAATMAEPKLERQGKAWKVVRCWARAAAERALDHQEKSCRR